MAQKIRLHDEVIVITGKSKNKKGKVKKVILSRNKLIISGVNFVKKHQKPNSSKESPGRILQIESPIDMSNVALYNQETGKPDKISFRIEKNKKIRLFKSNKKNII